MILSVSNSVDSRPTVRPIGSPLYTGTKFGVYGNHMQFRTFNGYEAVTSTVLSANAFNGTAYSMSSSDTGCSLPW